MKAKVLQRAADWYEELLQWTEVSVGNWEEGICSLEISTWNGDLLSQQNSRGKMEWTLPEVTQRSWWHRQWSTGQHPAAQYQYMLRWVSTMDELANAMVSLKDGNVPVGYWIPAWVWKHRGDNLLNILHKLITKALEDGVLYKCGIMPALYRSDKKRDRTTKLQMNLSSFHIRQDLRQDPSHQTIY